jgi:hypothetical protein
LGTGGFVTQQISVEPNTDYEIRFKVFNAEHTSGAFIIDLTDKPTPDTEFQYVLTPGRAAAWTEYSGRFNSVNEESIQLRLFTDPAFSGTVYMDHISVTAVPPR